VGRDKHGELNKKKIKKENRKTHMKEEGVRGEKRERAVGDRCGDYAGRRRSLGEEEREENKHERRGRARRGKERKGSRRPLWRFCGAGEEFGGGRTRVRATEQ
jgi:hypothetical protein